MLLLKVSNGTYLHACRCLSLISPLYLYHYYIVLVLSVYQSGSIYLFFVITWRLKQTIVSKFQSMILDCIFVVRKGGPEIQVPLEIPSVQIEYHNNMEWTS